MGHSWPDAGGAGHSRTPAAASVAGGDALIGGGREEGAVVAVQPPARLVGGRASGGAVEAPDATLDVKEKARPLVGTSTRGARADDGMGEWKHARPRTGHHGGSWMETRHLRVAVDCRSGRRAASPTSSPTFPTRITMRPTIYNGVKVLPSEPHSPSGRVGGATRREVKGSTSHAAVPAGLETRPLTPCCCVRPGRD